MIIDLIEHFLKIIISFAIGIAVAFGLYRAGKNEAKTEEKIDDLENENKQLKKINELQNKISNMSDADVDDILRKK